MKHGKFGFTQSYLMELNGFCKESKFTLLCLNFDRFRIEKEIYIKLQI